MTCSALVAVARRGPGPALRLLGIAAHRLTDANFAETVRDPSMMVPAHTLRNPLILPPPPQVTADTEARLGGRVLPPTVRPLQGLQEGLREAATNLEGLVKFGAVNADVAKKTASSAGVQGFPTVKIYMPEATAPYTGKIYKPALDYQGPRSARGVVDA